MKLVGHPPTTRVCSLCEAMCGLKVEVEGGQLRPLRGNPADVFSQGAFCPKAQGLADLAADPDRLRRPLKKTSDGFTEVSWAEAFGAIAERTLALQERYGRSSVATYLGNPNSHHAGSLLTLPLFLRAIGSRNNYSATSVDQLPHMLAAYLMFGHQLLLPIADVDHTDYMLIFGANPAVSGGSLLSSAGLAAKIKGIAKRGGKTVVVDPRYTETSSLASEHLFIAPGSDAFLLAAIVHKLLETPRLRHLEPLVEGLAELKTLFARDTWDEERVWRKTGVKAETVSAIAADLLRSDKAVCYGRVGVSTQRHGGLCQWLINLINILSGNLDRPGGALFTKPAVDMVAITARFGSRGSFARRRSRVRQLPEFSGEFPAATLADEMLTPGDGQIRGLFTVAGNPVLSLPNGPKLEAGIKGLELYVAIDFYQNETTSLADYILPPVTALEAPHYDLIFNAFASRNVSRYSPPVLEPAKDSMEDWEILLELWARLVPRKKRLSRLKRQVTTMLARRGGLPAMLDLLLRFGPYRGLSVKKLKAQPNGVDLGPLQPSLAQRLGKPERKIKLCPTPFAEAWAELSRQLQADEVPPAGLDLQVIGRRNLKSNNSWMHNCPSLNKGRNQCYVQMHTDDAKRRQLQDGATVTVTTAVGAITLPLMVNDRIMPGVICIPHGWGHHRRGTKQSLASASPGVSLNDVLNDHEVDPFCGNAVLNGQWAKVSKSAI